MSQRGSLRKRGKTWTVYYRDPDGRQRTKGGFQTASTARGFLTVKLGEIAVGSYHEPAKITVRSLADDHWLPAIRNGSGRGGQPRRASTLASYELAVRLYINPNIGDQQIAALTPRDIEAWLGQLAASGGRKGRPLGQRSVQYAHLVLRMALDYAVKRRMVLLNVACEVDRPGVRRKEMTAWNASEAQTFLASVRNDRLEAAWVLALSRGPRRGEIAGLRWADIDLAAGRMTVVHTLVVVAGKVESSTPKTKAGERSIPLDPALVGILKRHRKAQMAERLAWGATWQDSGYVFTKEDGSAINPEQLTDRFDVLVKAAAVPRIRFHDLRHTAATLMLAGGTPVKVASEMLGHSNPSVTQSLYQHVLPGMAENAGEMLSGVLGLGVDKSLTS